MDDPWGSPWADEAQIPNSINYSPKETRVLENTPTTPVPAPNLNVQEKTDSPWGNADDESFGEWATLPAGNGGNLGFDEQADEWGSPAPTAITKNDVDALSLAWNDSPETKDDRNTKLALGSYSKEENLARQPSPDPWATTSAVDVGIEGSHKDQILEVQDVLEAQEGELRDPSPIGKVIAESMDQNSLPDEKEIKPQDVTLVLDTITTMEVEETHEDLTPVLPQTPGAENPDSDHPSSRPSSSPSEHSQHDGISQESPRTSFDEEPTRPQSTRKVSSKIKELVEHFDGLAKQEIGGTVASSSSSGQETVKNGGESEDDDDFGDFEEGHSDEEESEELPVPSKLPESQDAPLHVGEAPTKPIPRFTGPVDFDIDTSTIAKLYPDLDPDAPFQKVFIMDAIPFESFETTEERKTWYRISRYGTMRKHNTGDDDYVRISWPRSEVRTETLKIVARWMEEDRISGRVVLGGASKGSSIFGWNDKKAAPVALTEALAAKEVKSKVDSPAPIAEIPREWPQELVRKASTSKRPSSHGRRRSSLKPASVSEETKSAVELPVANFGWNKAAQKSQSLDRSSHGHKSQGSESSRQSPQSRKHSPVQKSSSTKRPPNGSITTTAKATSPRPSSKNQAPTKPPPEKLDPGLSILATLDLIKDDVPFKDEGDWGEMVDTPVAAVSSNSIKGKSPDNGTPIRTTNTAVHSSRITAFDAPLFDFDSNTPLQPNSKQSTVVPDPGITHSPDPVATTQISSVSPPPSSVNPAIDPWAMADLSFFDTGPSSTPTPAPKPVSTYVSKQPSKASSKTVTFSPSPILPPITHSNNSSSIISNQRSREETEQDRIVQRVVKGLPDLSYMLRR